MARWGTLLYAVGVFLSGAGKTDAFYLPGKAPSSYSEAEKVRILSTKAQRSTHAKAQEEARLVGGRFSLAILLLGHVGRHVCRTNALRYLTPPKKTDWSSHGL